MKSPSIIFNLKYFTHNDNSSENDFYRCKNSHNIVSYVSRENSNENITEEEQNIIKNFVEISGKSEYDITDYASKRKGSQGIFSSSGTLTDGEVSAIKKKLSTTKATIYSSVISFSSEFGESFLTTSEEGRELINSNLSKLFTNSEIDVNNINWFGAVHTNTAHHHIHFFFWEKEPQRIDAKGNKTFSRKNNLKKCDIEEFKASILNTIKNKKIDYFSMRDEVRSGAVNALKNNYLLFEYFAKSCSDIIEGDNYQYGRLSREQQRKIDKFVKQILAIDKSVENKYKNYKQKLRDTHLDYLALYKENNSKFIPNSVKNFYSSRITDLNTRLGNDFLKMLKKYIAHNQPEKEILDTKIGKPEYHSLKKPFIRKSSSLGTELLIDFVKSADAEVSTQLISIEEFVREKLEKGETIIYEQDE